MPTTVHIRTAHNATDADDAEPQTLTYVSAAAAADELAAAGLVTPLPGWAVPGVDGFAWGSDHAGIVTVVELVDGDRAEFDHAMWTRANLAHTAQLVSAARAAMDQVMRFAQEYATQARRAGRSENSVASGLGVSRSTVRGWFPPES